MRRGDGLRRISRRVEGLRHQLERLPPPTKSAAELAEEEQLWERACKLYEQGEDPQSDDDPRLFGYLDTITKYAPVLIEAINEGIIVVPSDDDAVGSSSPRGLSGP